MITADSDVKTALKMLGDAIVSFFGCAVILGIENRVPIPQGSFVSMTPIRQERQSTNETSYPDRAGTTTYEADRKDLIYSTLVVQLDVYGTDAREIINGLLMLSRSDLLESGYGITPLFSTDPANMPFVDGEMQNRERWTLDMNLQFNLNWEKAQDTALDITLDNFYEVEQL